MLISLDIETTGLSHKHDKITCVGVYSDVESAVFRTAEDFNLWIEANEHQLQLVGHNFKFDILFLRSQWGIDLMPYWAEDTQLMAATLTKKIPTEWLERYEERRKIRNKLLPTGVEHRKAGATSLKSLAPYYLGVEPFWEDPTNHDSDEYVLKDCKYTYELCKVLSAELRAAGQETFYRDRMLPWAKMLCDVEYKGLPINMDVLAEMKARLKGEVVELEKELDERWKSHHEVYHTLQQQTLKHRYKGMAEAAVAKLKDRAKAPDTRVRYANLYKTAAEKLETKINYASPAQMAWLLKERLNLDITSLDGEESTGAPVLRQLAEQGQEDLQVFLKWKGNQKLISSFLEPWEEKQVDNRLYASFNLTGTRTGRLSSSSPNLQNISSKLYPIIKAPEGRKILSFDQGAIEAKLIAFYSDDLRLTEIVQQGHSIHDYNVAHVFFPELGAAPADVKEKYPLQRKIAKTVGFAIFYGAGVNRIVHAFKAGGVYITKADATAMLSRFRKFYSGAYKYHQQVTRLFEEGAIIPNIMGRPVKIQPDENAYMQGFNTLIQSSGSDIVLRGAERAKEEWDSKGLDCDLISFVHDAVLAEAAAEDAEAAAAILVQKMEGFELTNKWGRIKLEAEGAISDEWAK